MRVYKKKNRGGFYGNIGGKSLTLGSDQKAAQARLDSILAAVAAGYPFEYGGGWFGVHAKTAIPLTATTKGAAADELDAIKTGRVPVSSGESSETLIDEVFAQFLDHFRDRPRVYNLHRIPIHSFQDWLAKEKLKLRLSEIKIHHVTAWHKKCRTLRTVKTKDGEVVVPYSDTTAHNDLRSIREAFSWAAKEERIPYAPLRGLKLPMQDTRDCALDADQWAKVLTAIDSPEHRDAMVAMRDTGCRPDELRRVEARHFERTKRCWIFPWQEQKTGKRTKSNRVVPLTDSVYAICERLALAHPAGPLFRNSKGDPWTSSALVQRNRALSTKVGFRVIAYGARHSFASDLASQVPSVLLARMMGHSDTDMLAKVYAKIPEKTMVDQLREVKRA